MNPSPQDIEIPESNSPAPCGVSSSFDLCGKVADLQSKLLESHPLIPSLLRTIHTQLRSDPELVTTLSEDEIGIIVRGLMHQTHTELVSSTPKPKSAAAELKKAVKSGNLLDSL